MRSALSTAWLGGVFAVALSSVAACGPNQRTVYEGENEFERCYALDRDPGTANEDRAQCWAYWQQTYTYGQNPERVRVARERLTALSSGGAQGGPQPQGGAGDLAGGGPTAPQPASVGYGAPGEPGATSGSPGARPGYAPPVAVVPPGVTASITPAPNRAGSGGNAPSDARPPSGGRPPAPVAAPPTGITCSSQCRESWSSCGTSCAREATCVAGCDDSFRDCMRGCY